jgi:hypothetical protein
VRKWCLSRRELRTGNSKGPETIVLPVIEAFKNLLSIALLTARYKAIFMLNSKKGD